MLKFYSYLIILSVLLLGITNGFSATTKEQPTKKEGKFAGYHQTTKDVYTSEVIENGSYLMLSDNSVWCVSPKDTIISGGWISPAKVKIEKSNNPSYPYTIYNTLTQDKINVKKSSLKDIHEAKEKKLKSQRKQQLQHEELKKEEKTKQQELLK
jgi:hypothetical protein